MPGSARTVEVGPARIAGWFAGFADRHGRPQASVSDGALHLRAQDGSTASCRALLPFAPAPADDNLDVLGAGSGDARPDEALELIAAFTVHAAAVVPVALLLVRRGGYGIALVEGANLTRHKVGSRYVQSRTAAGGWSQQRFARRRENQAAGLLDAAAQAAVRLLLGGDGRTASTGLVVVTGGDRTLAERLLADRRLAGLAAAPRPRHLDVTDPRAEVLRQAATRAVAVRVAVMNA